MDIGTSPSGLFEKSDCFKLKFDATDRINEWPDAEGEVINTRYGYNVATAAAAPAPLGPRKALFRCGRTAVRR